VLQRVEEGIFLPSSSMEVHAWRPFDSFFRLITARRNPNLIMLTLCGPGGRPDIGFTPVAVWTAICLVVHAVQILQGLAAPKGVVLAVALTRVGVVRNPKSHGNRARHPPVRRPRRAAGRAR
jgi:hypothetical protein